MRSSSSSGREDALGVMVSVDRFERDEREVERDERGSVVVVVGAWGVGVVVGVCNEFK